MNNDMLRRRPDGKMIFRRMLRIFPFQVLGSISTLVLILVDGLVVGNILGADALAGVNLLLPLSTLMGALCGMTGSGISVTVSKAMVYPDSKAVPRTYRAAFFSVLITMIAVAVIEVPAARLIIGSYDLSDEMVTNVWAYSSGIMVSFVIGIISTAGTFMLVATGQAKKLAMLACIEGSVNICLDLLFVGPLEMGVAGAGWATAISNCVRSTLTVIILCKTLKIFPLIKESSKKEMILICRHGFYRLCNDLMLFIKSYIIIDLILDSLGSQGYTAYTVACFGITVKLLLAASVSQAAGPFYGIYTGIGEWRNGRRFFMNTLLLDLIIGIALLCIMVFSPSALLGVYGIAASADLSLRVIRIMGIAVPAVGMNSLIQNYMTYCGMKSYASAFTLLQNVVVLIPLCFLFTGFSRMGVFIAFCVSNYLILAVGILVFGYYQRKRIAEESGMVSLNLSVTSSEASDFSIRIKKFFLGIPETEKLANRISVCAEEAVAYVEAVNKEHSVEIDLLFRVFNDKVNFFSINNGKNEALANETVGRDNQPAANNFFFMKKLADEYSYHNICGLNSYSLVFMCARTGTEQEGKADN